MPTARSRGFQISGRSIPWVVGLLVAGLVLSTIPAPSARAQTADVVVDPARQVFEPGQPVELMVQNNGSLPTEGTAEVRVYHLPTCADLSLCAPSRTQVHRWSSGQTELGPGENLTVRWDRVTDGGREAPEGVYEAELAWNTTSGSGDQEDTSPRFKLENATGGGPSQGAPRISVISPLAGSTLDAGDPVTIQVRLEGTEPLESVTLHVDGRLVENRNDVDRRVLNLSVDADVLPGTHVLEISARDEASRTNRTAVSFAVASGDVLGSGPLVYQPAQRGTIEDVRLTGERLFHRIAPDPAGLGLQASTQAKALVLTAHGQGTVIYDLAPGWSADQAPRGILLEDRDSDRTAVLVAVDGGIPRMDGDRIVADVVSGTQLVLRPTAPGAVDERISQAVLDGWVGAEVTVGAEDATTVRYGDLDAPASVRADRLTVLLTAPAGTSRVVVVDLPDEASLEGTPTARLDGRELPRADDLQDVLDPSDDGRSEMLVVDEGDDRRVIVSVSSFSTRELVVEAAAQVGAFLTPGAIAGALLVVGAASWGLLRRPEP